MVLTNTDLRIWYLLEANYAGGHAGIEFAMTGPTAVDALTSINYLAGDVKLKAKIFKRKRIKAPGLGLGKGKVVTTGAEFPEIEFSYYLQTLADPFKVESVEDVVGLEGKAGHSYIFQVVVPDPDESAATLVYNVFGAQLTSYSVKGGISDEAPPMVTVKFECYDIVINAASPQTGILPTGVINEWDDMVVTLDADPIVELKSFTLTITRIFTKIGSGRNSTWAKFKPLLVDRKLELKVTLYKDVAALMTDTITEILNTFVSIWTDGTNTINVTECHVESDNFMEYKGDDIVEVEHELTIVNGNSVFT